MLDLDSWPHTPHGVLLLTLLLGLPDEHAQESEEESIDSGHPRSTSQDKDLFIPEKQRVGITDNDRKQRKRGREPGKGS